MTGPYTRASTVVGPWSHNPVIIAVPDSPPAYLLFHIGIGCTTEGVHSCNYTRMPTCTNGTTPVDVHAGTVPVPNPANLTRAHTHMAESLDGPWVSIPGACPPLL